MKKEIEKNITNIYTQMDGSKVLYKPRESFSVTRQSKIFSNGKNLFLFRTDHYVDFLTTVELKNIRAVLIQFPKMKIRIIIFCILFLFTLAFIMIKSANSLFGFISLFCCLVLYTCILLLTATKKVRVITDVNDIQIASMLKKKNARKLAQKIVDLMQPFLSVEDEESEIENGSVDEEDVLSLLEEQEREIVAERLEDNEA